VGTQKLQNVKCTQAPKLNLPVLQPTPKVFHYQNVMSYPFTRVPASVQIRYKGCEPYAKVIDGHAPTNRGALEQPPYQGKI
jgi:hypothetical protein